MLDLLTATDHADPYDWAAVALAHVATGAVLMAVAAGAIGRAAPWIAGRGQLALVTGGYLLVWEIGLQRLGAGWADALLDTAMVAAGAGAGYLAWRRAGPRLGALLLATGLALAAGIRARWRR